MRTERTLRPRIVEVERRDSRPVGDEVMVSYCLAALDSKLAFVRGKNTRSQSAADPALARRMAWPTRECEAVGLVRLLRSGSIMVDETLVEVVWARKQ